MPAFGAASTPAFGFGAASTPAFGAASAPAFGATSAPAFGFGAASTPPAFGAASAPAFGASSASLFGASSAPAFGGTSLFGGTQQVRGGPAVPERRASLSCRTALLCSACHALSLPCPPRSKPAPPLHPLRCRSRPGSALVLPAPPPLERRRPRRLAPPVPACLGAAVRQVRLALPHTPAPPHACLMAPTFQSCPLFGTCGYGTPKLLTCPRVQPLAPAPASLVPARRPPASALRPPSPRPRPWEARWCLRSQSRLPAWPPARMACCQSRQRCATLPLPPREPNLGPPEAALQLCLLLRAPAAAGKMPRLPPCPPTPQPFPIFPCPAPKTLILRPFSLPQVSPAPEYKVGLTQRPAGLLAGGPPRPAALITPRSITPRSGVRMRPRRSMSATRMSKSPADFLAAATAQAGGTPGGGEQSRRGATPRLPLASPACCPIPTLLASASLLLICWLVGSAGCRRPRRRLHPQWRHLCAAREPAAPVCARCPALHRGSRHHQRQPCHWRHARRHARAAHARHRPAHLAGQAGRRRRGRQRRRRRRLPAGRSARPPPSHLFAAAVAAAPA